MADIIKKGDFVEVEYTGSLKEPEDIVFDTTDEKLAKEKGIYSQNMIYGPIVICVGEAQILKGLDNNIEGKELGKEYSIELGPEEAFGKKDASLLKLVPMSAFKKQNITPMPGLQINIDNMIGTIKTASGGRIIVDFNHPLSGKQVIYKVKTNKKITDKAEQIKSYIMLKLNIKPDSFKVQISGDIASLEFKAELHKELKHSLNEKLVELVKVKKVDFGLIKEQEKSEEKNTEQEKKQKTEEKKEPEKQ